MHEKTSIRNWIGHLWETNRPLTGVGIGMLVVLALALAGMVVDPRSVGGVPAWLKPAKFTISTSVYSFTIVWIFTYLQDWPRLKRIVGATTAVVFVLEVGLIELQAGRGVSSHFNVATRFDAAIFAVMGLAILLVWLTSIAMTVAVFRQHFVDDALGWAIRLGLLVTVLGSGIGGLMTRPTETQLASARESHRMTVAGAHTVGAPDGGPGVFGTGWSRDHGDLRVPHFVGLHALQTLPLLALMLRSVSSGTKRRRAVLVAGASYATLLGILLVQALSGQSLLAPEGAIASAFLVWLTTTILAMTTVLMYGRGPAIADVKGMVW